MIVHHPRLVAGLLGAALALGTAAVAAPAAQAADPVTEVGLYGTTDPTYDGVFRQSLAILGLHAAGRTPAPEAVAWLLRQQCADGSFSSYNADTTKDCPAFDAGTFTGGADTNATALAVQALRAVGTPAATAAAARAATRLAAWRQGDGGWEYTPGSGGGTDPNSTGLVLTALNAAGLAPADPEKYFLTVQVGRGDFAGTPAADRGGIATPWAAGTPDDLATVQSVPGLRGADLTRTPDRSVGWLDGARTYTDASPADAAGVAGWASAYLVGRAGIDAISTSNKAWAVLSLAWDRSGEDAARALYADLHAAAAVTGPAANGQLALAAAAVGRTADIPAYADRIAASLTRDTTAPTATWTVRGTTAWAKAPVTLTRTALSDAFWPASSLTQRIAWGDGTTTTVAAGTTSVPHRYSSPGTRTVRVTVTDPSGNARTTTVATIAVRTDSTRPTAAVVRPSSPSTRGAWSPVLLRASDTRSGVRTVQVRLTQKRSSGWWHFTGTRWVKGASAPWVAAARVSGTSTRWSVAAGTPRTGRLVVAVRAVDAAGNRSRTATTTATLSR